MFSLRIILFSIFSLSAFGCSIGPKYVKPTVQIPAAYKESADWSSNRTLGPQTGHSVLKPDTRSSNRTLGPQTGHSQELAGARRSSQELAGAWKRAQPQDAIIRGAWWKIFKD